MPRPRKLRQVCGMPLVDRFTPQTAGDELREPVVLTIDQFETIRLIDYEMLTQEECAKYMNVARTTVQAIYQQARQGIARALVEGRPLIIAGGEYQLCEQRNVGHGRCRHQGHAYRRGFLRKE
ncbi:MAG: DUF134 domain-containing protein [Bacilli bacterium]